MKLIVKRDAFELIIKTCVDEYPFETAGLMLGSGSKVYEVIPVRNVHEHDHRVRYRIDPMDYYEAEKSAEVKGLEVLGVYHSHPDHPPTPSAYDLEYALPPWYYLIISVTSGKALGYGCWKAVEKEGLKTFEKAELFVE